MAAPRNLDCGSIQHISLEDPERLRYETISYAWGDTQLATSINVDDSIIRIPFSAASALRCMRYQAESRVIWIDCICIDQTDEDEKGQQVGLMAQIYRGSDATLAHLGDDPGFAKSVFGALSNIHESAFWSEGKMEFGEPPHADAKDADIQWKDVVNWREIRSVLCVPYFRRLWIVQEVVLPPRAIICCGEARIPSKALIMALSCLRNQVIEHYLRPGGIHRADLAEDVHEVVDGIMAFLAISWSTKNNTASLSSILEYCGSLNSTDPRDRVFGILGLLKSRDPTHLLPPRLIPHYKKSIADVYRDATREAIRDSNNLDIFDVGLAGKPLDGLPSWVPGWYDYNLELSKLPRVDFRASDGIHFLHPLEDDNPNVLTLRGFILDTVQAQCARIRIGADEASDEHIGTTKELLLYLAKADALAEEWASISEGPAPGPTELGFALVAGCIAGRRANQEDMVGFHVVRYCIKAQSPSGEIEEECLHNIPVEYRELVSRFCERVADVRRQRFFVTKSGRMGLGPPSLRRGDMIAILAGTPWPYIIRHAEVQGADVYTVIGAAYLHGIMDGEAAQEHLGRGKEFATVSFV